MDGNDIETIMSGIVTHRDVQGLVVVLHAHDQTLGKRFGSRALLDDVPIDQYLYSVGAGNAAFLCPEQRVVAPRNASGSGCGSNNSDIKRHVS